MIMSFIEDGDILFWFLNKRLSGHSQVLRQVTLKVKFISESESRDKFKLNVVHASEQIELWTG